MVGTGSTHEARKGWRILRETPADGKVGQIPGRISPSFQEAKRVLKSPADLLPFVLLGKLARNRFTLRRHGGSTGGVKKFKNISVAFDTKIKNTLGRHKG